MEQMFFEKRKRLTGHSLIIRSGEGTEAADFFRSIQEDGGGAGNEAHGEMSDGHLITNGAHFIMGGLLDLAIAEA